MPDHKPFRTTRPVASLRAGRNDWYRIKAQAEGPAQLHIYDEIGFFGVTAGDMIADLAGLKGDLEVHLNTPGGEVFDGIAIYQALKNRDGLVRVVVDSLAASIGSVIAMAADPGNLIIGKNASMMIHDGFGMGIGNAKDLRELADLLDKTSGNIASIYADRTGQPAAQWREAMLAETWYIGQEAVDAGLADFLQGEEPADTLGPALKIAATWDLSIFARRPAHLRGADDPAGPDAPASCDPDGDGDDDSSPETDTDHDYWDEDGNQIQDLPGRPMPKKAENRRGGRPAGSAPTDTGAAHSVLNAEKYSADDRKAMAGKEAMDDGSYPVKDAEDLDNAIHAVGRGGADHDAIRRHVIERADALGLSSKIPENWNSDGSLKDGGSSNQAAAGFLNWNDEVFENIRAALEDAR